MTKNHSPFSLFPDGESQYQLWREWKLRVYAKKAKDLLISVNDPFVLTVDEQQQLEKCFIQSNMAIYTISMGADFRDKKIVDNLGSDFGLNQLDNNLGADSNNITSIQVIEGGRKQGYIPYSNSKLSWHTDGYYNLPSEQIRAFILHCVSSADEGGENALLDHEMMYIHLRDLDPAYISALMQSDVLTIPPNIENDVEIRGVQSGPVFSVDEKSGALHMRYSARKRNIIWKDDDITTKAVNAINDFLSSDSPWILRHRLEPGQGLICNNILHNRTSFKNDEANGIERLIYRGRYYDRLADTSFDNIALAMSS